MLLYIYIYIHTHILYHVYVYVYIYIYIHICIHECLFIYAHAQLEAQRLRNPRRVAVRSEKNKNKYTIIYDTILLHDTVLSDVM